MLPMARQSFTAFDAICAAGTLVASGWVVYEAHQDGLRSTRGSRPAPDAAFTQTTRLLRPEHMIAMQRDGFVLIPNALSALQLKDARAAVSALRLGQEFHHTGQESHVRRDSVVWIGGENADADGRANEPPSAPALPLPPGSSPSPLVPLPALPLLAPALELCCDVLRGVGHAIEQQRLGAGARGSDGNESLHVPLLMQLARYEPTGFYAAHRDNALGPNETILDAGLLGWLRTHGQRRRAVTAILYLNAPDWDCALSGGALRCYPDATDACAGGALGSAEMEGAGRHVDVVPTGGSLLLFDSRRLLHQVNPVTGSDDRFALTAWIFGADTHWLHGGPLVEKTAAATMNRPSL